jgi:hypothetical protein
LRELFCDMKRGGHSAAEVAAMMRKTGYIRGG